MTGKVDNFSGSLIVLLSVLVAGCASTRTAPQFAVEKDISRIIELRDGSTCLEPAGLAESRQSPGAVLLAELLETQSGLDESVARAKAFNLKHDEIEAVYFDACRDYANATIDRSAFEKRRKIHLELRQHLVARSVRQWLEKKDGLADPGKLCLVILPGTDPEQRSFTRVLPLQSTVTDCAQLASASGSDEILLGCTKGNWENAWARNPISLYQRGANLRGLTGKDASYTPLPNCGWT